MRVRCYVLSSGPGPAEQIVEIETADGREEVVVDQSLVHDGALMIRRVLERRKNRSLIELPRESASGRWRVWVDDSVLAAG